MKKLKYMEIIPEGFVESELTTLLNSMKDNSKEDYYLVPVPFFNESVTYQDKKAVDTITKKIGKILAKATNERVAQIKGQIPTSEVRLLNDIYKDSIVQYYVNLIYLMASVLDDQI